MTAQQKKHVLFVTLHFQGHLNPTLRLAKRLISKGLSVTVATTDVARRRVPAAGPISFEFFSYGGLAADFGGRTDLFLECLATHGSESFSKLLTDLSANGRKFQCLVSSPFLPWVVDVAAEHRLPCAVLWIQACGLYEIYYRFFKSPHLFESVEDPDGAVCLPGLPGDVAVRDLPSIIKPAGPAHLKKVVGQFVGVLDKVKWVLGNSFQELEEAAVEVLWPESSVLTGLDCAQAHTEAMAATCPIRAVGPLVSPSLLEAEETVAGNVDMWPAEDYCIEWLDTKPPSSVIYIAFGSVNVLSQINIDNISKALINSDKSFLWVLKPADYKGSKKGGELSAGFIKETKGRGLVVTWCSQERVLAHKSVACFMTHCGWNSSIEAVAAGVPVIAFPERIDQPVNARLLVDLFKTGVNLTVGEDGVVTTQEVERCFKELTEGPKSTELKLKAVEWKEAARKAVEEGGSSDRNLDRFISEITLD